MVEIVAAMEEATHHRALYNIINRGAIYSVDTSRIAASIERCKVCFDESYLQKRLKSTMDDRRVSIVEVSIIVPVFRSETILSTLVDRISEAMSSQRLEFELILVNDASPDRSWEVIEQLAAEHAFVLGICLTKNVGQHNATMAGLGHANGEIIVIMDDDLQHPPEAIMSLVDAIRAGNDVCYAKYFNRQHELWKKIGSWVNDRVATVLLKKPAGLYLSSFKALHRRIVTEIVKYDGPYAYIDGIVLDVTQRITAVTIQHRPRFAGEGITIWDAPCLYG